VEQKLIQEPLARLLEGRAQRATSMLLYRTTIQVFAKVEDN
jgi:hypothetical protein